MEKIKPNTGSREFLTVDEMAGMLSIAKATAYQLTKITGFPCFYIGKRIIIPTNAFIDWAVAQANTKASVLPNDIE